MEQQAEQQFQIGEQLIGKIFGLINKQPYGEVAQLAAELGMLVQNQKKDFENAKKAGEIPPQTG